MSSPFIVVSTLHWHMDGVWLSMRPDWHGLSVLLRRSYCLYLRVSMTGQWMCMKPSFRPALCQLSRMGCPWSAGQKLSLLNVKQNLQLVIRLMDTSGPEYQTIMPESAGRITIQIRRAWRMTFSLQVHILNCGPCCQIWPHKWDVWHDCAVLSFDFGWIWTPDLPPALGRKQHDGLQWPCLCTSSAIGYSHHAHWHGDTSLAICFRLWSAAG